MVGLSRVAGLLGRLGGRALAAPPERRVVGVLLRAVPGVGPDHLEGAAPDDLDLLVLGVLDHPGGTVEVEDAIIVRELEVTCGRAAVEKPRAAVVQEVALSEALAFGIGVVLSLELGHEVRGHL